jgi:hypothetical protein
MFKESTLATHSRLSSRRFNTQDIVSHIRALSFALQVQGRCAGD